MLRVAAEREHVRDSLSLHPVEDLARPVCRVRAREVGHGLDVVVALDSSHKLESLLSGPQPVGHGDPIRRVTGKRGHGPFEHVDLAFVAWRHEFK